MQNDQIIGPQQSYEPIKDPKEEPMSSPKVAPERWERWMKAARMLEVAGIVVTVAGAVMAVVLPPVAPWVLIAGGVLMRSSSLLKVRALSLRDSLPPPHQNTFSDEERARFDRNQMAWRVVSEVAWVVTIAVAPALAALQIVHPAIEVVLSLLPTTLSLLAEHQITKINDLLINWEKKSSPPEKPPLVV